MKRDIIIIEDKTVSVTGNEVWMTAGEIAEEFHATVPAVNAAIKAVRKSDVLNDYEMQKRDAKKGLATLCIGGGMGCATIVERD